MNNTLPPHQSAATNFIRQVNLYYQRREALANGPAGMWHSYMGEVYYPDDPQKGRQYFEEKLDEEVSVHGHRIFIDGTAMPRVMPPHDEYI